MKNHDIIYIVFEPSTVEINTNQYDTIINSLSNIKGFDIYDMKNVVINELRNNKKLLFRITKNNDYYSTRWDYFFTIILNNKTRIYNASEILSKNINYFLINFKDSPNYKPKQLIYE
jgi:hypothetical protein